MTTKAKYVYGVETHYDDQTFEQTLCASPIQFSDDFTCAGHTAGVPAAGSPVAGYAWVKKLVDTAGTPAVAIVANGAGGQVSCSLDATSEKQEATLYANDQLTFDATKGLVYQARIKLSVLPSASGVQAVWGLSSAWIDGPDNASYYVEFGATANGTILMRCQDGVNQKSVSTGVTVLATAWHIYRIEIDLAGVVHFFIDGVEYSTSTSPITFAATGANAILQLYSSVYKPSGTGVATLLADVIEAWSSRT